MCAAPLWGLLQGHGGEGRPKRPGRGPRHRRVPGARCERDAAAPTVPLERTASAESVEGMFRKGFPGYSEAENLRP